MRIRLFTVSMLLIVLAALSAQAYRLTYKDTAGVKRTYKNVLSITGTIDIAGKSMPITSSINMTTIESVLSVSGDTASISSKTSDGKMVMNMPDPQNAGATKSTEAPIPDIAMTFDRTVQGKVSNYKLTTNLPGVPSQSMSNSPMNSGSTEIVFPDKDLNTGDTWESKQDMTIPGSEKSVAVNIKYTLSGTEVVDGKTYLKLLCQYSADPASTSMTVGDGDQAKSMKISISMNGTSTSLFNEQAGEVYRSDLKLHIDVKVKGDPSDPEFHSLMDMTGSAVKS